MGRRSTRICRRPPATQRHIEAAGPTSGRGSPLCQVLGEDLFFGRVVMVAEALFRVVGRAGLAVGVRGRLVAAARTGLAGATGRVGSAGSPGCGLSEESRVGVGSAALDVRVAP